MISDFLGRFARRGVGRVGGSHLDVGAVADLLPSGGTVCHCKACMTEIYLHIDARMADYIRTHP